MHPAVNGLNFVNYILKCLKNQIFHVDDLDLILICKSLIFLPIEAYIISDNGSVYFYQSQLVDFGGSEIFLHLVLPI